MRTLSIFGLLIFAHAALGLGSAKTIEDAIAETSINNGVFDTIWLQPGMIFCDQVGVNVIQSVSEHQIRYAVMGDDGKLLDKAQQLETYNWNAPHSVAPLVRFKLKEWGYLFTRPKKPRRVKIGQDIGSEILVFSNGHSLIKWDKEVQAQFSSMKYELASNHKIEPISSN